ncbi:MAG: cytochrome c biogenesis protein CcdA [Spirochaetales bacterium]|nr:cytochrome c biogenesis protein CcdA [Spirochaetales bacterium]
MIFKKTMIPALLVFILSPLTAELRISPESLTLPEAGGSSFDETVIFFNDDERSLSIDIISSAEGWSTEPAILDLEAGETGELRIRGVVNHPEDTVALLMLSDREDVPYIYSILPYEEDQGAKAAVKGIASEDGGSGFAEPAGVSGMNPFLFFHSPGCEICELFYSRDLPALEEELGLTLNPERKNVFESGNFELLESLAAERSLAVRSFPLLVVGDRFFSGERGIRKEFPEYLREAVDNGGVPRAESEGNGSAAEAGGSEGEAGGVLPDLRWLPVFLAGLLDGINPCAFTSLIFLISYLRLLGKRGKEVIKIGSSFTLAVFLTYFLVGLGAFRFIRMADSFSLISVLIKYILGGVLLVLAAVSLVDWLRVRRGRANESILQLSAKTKKRIHRVVRTSSRSSLVYLSSFGAGFLISLYELGCTGQIYLPMLVYMVKQEQWSALAPLTLYNVAFILPLVLVFVLFYKGSDSEKIGRVFERHLGKIKLAGALLFLVMGIFILLV